MNDTTSQPRIVTPQEAQPLAELAARMKPKTALEAEWQDLAHTVATEPERLARAYAEGEAAAWNRHRPEWEHKPNPYAAENRTTGAAEAQQ